MKSYKELGLEFIQAVFSIDLDVLKQIEQLFLQTKKDNKKICFIGNGGSAAICSHMAIDYSKNGKIKSIAFNDASLLTCLANDYGFENLFYEAMKLYCEEGDVLVAISSSGRSLDIINGIKAANELKMPVVTFTGFDKENTLKRLGSFNIYVKSYSYRIVELVHEYSLHTILERIENKN